MKLVVPERVITVHGRDPMPTQCNAEQLQFSCIEGCQVVAGLDGGTVRAQAGVDQTLAQDADRAARLWDGAGV